MQLVNEQNDLVSIILPVHNHEAYLATCLESLLSQSHTNLEIIAIDDFSRDNSYQILKSFRKQDNRLKIYRNVKYYGMRLTLQRCINRAKGNYIAFMNPKDTSAKSRLKRQLSMLSKNPKTAAVGTQCYFIDENDNVHDKSAFPVEHEAIYKTLLHGLSIQPESIMVDKRRLPKDILTFSNDKYPFIYIRMLLNVVKYGELMNIPTNLYNKRQIGKALQRGKNSLPYIVKLWIKQRTSSGYRLPLSTLVLPLVKYL